MPHRRRRLPESADDPEFHCPLFDHITSVLGISRYSQARVDGQRETNYCHDSPYSTPQRDSPHVFLDDVGYSDCPVSVLGCGHSLSLTCTSLSNPDGQLRALWRFLTP